MEKRPRGSRSRGAFALALLAAALLLVGGSSRPRRMAPPSPQVSAPPAVKSGSYQGTWLYADRMTRLAFWFDEQNGKLKVRYRYDLKTAGYGDSGQDGAGPCSSGTGPGTFTLTYRLDPDGIVRGKMVRKWPNGPGEDDDVTESNDFEAYRIGLGDELYCLFKNRVRESKKNGQPVGEPLGEFYFTFRKVTDEMVFWEELKS